MNKNITRSMLTNSMFLGLPIALWASIGDGRFALVNGRVVGISLESSPPSGRPACSFNVEIVSNKTNKQFQTYVRTID